MKFSELFNIQLANDDNWFDPILSLDTRLFLDPFLLYAAESDHFEGSHDEVIVFFNSVFKLISRSKGNRSSVLWRKAQNSLVFHEVEELCLGYTNAGTGGSGSGRLLARVIAEALWEAVQAGLKEITHFEEIGILREGIGADRISDITANLIRSRLAAYTKDICIRHGIQTGPTNYFHGKYDVQNERWVPITTQLPRNPYNGKPILLAPLCYLRDLPTIDAYDFWEYCYSNENETLRNEYSYDVTRKVDKKTIVELARNHPELRQRYLKYVEKKRPQSYNLEKDPLGLYKWYEASAAYCSRFPVSFSISSEEDFCQFIHKLVETFIHFVEQNRGWELLWNDNKTPRKEAASQNLFLGIVKHYCHVNNIDISRETNIGRGPVDFKFSQGFRWRALLEVKKADNTRFWNGLKKQLPTYQHAEQIRIGYFLVIAYNRKDLKRVDNIQKQIAQVSKDTGYKLSAVVVNAHWGPPSASRL